MRKEELIERIIDRFTAMGSESEEDTAYADEIDLEHAGFYLDELRVFERADLEEEDRLPAEVTPELYMEAFNCYLRKCRYDVTVERLADYLKNNCDVALYDNYRTDWGENNVEIIPVDFWYNYDYPSEFPFGFGNRVSGEDIMNLIEIVCNSKKTCDLDKEYIWYDKENKIIHTTADPYADGIIDTHGFAEFLLSSPPALNYVVADMDPDRMLYVFSYLFFMNDKLSERNRIHYLGNVDREEQE